jgi:hypothetical protein
VSAWNVQTLARWARFHVPALDAEVELSMDNDVENSTDNDESQALAVGKVSRTQNLHGKECAASKLAEVLRLRKLKSGHSQYWAQ